MEYTLKDLFSIRQGIQNILNKDKEYNIKFVYILRKNLKKIEEEIKDIKGQFKDDAEGFEKFQNKRFEVAKEYGGKEKQTGDGIRYIENIEDQEGFDKAVKELEEEYKEVLEEQEKIQKANQKIAEEKLAKINWKPLKLEYFNENVTGDEFPQAIFDLIEEEE